MKKKYFGKCALCCTECELTYEHIPPRAAFNAQPAKRYTGEELIKKQNSLPWDVSGTKYISQQQGVGVYSLCANCNNLTGTWYGDTYQKMSRCIVAELDKWIAKPPKYIQIEQLPVAQFLKQVLSFFCSINNKEFCKDEVYSENPIDKSELPSAIRVLVDAQNALFEASSMVDELRAFVLDKKAKNLDKKKFKICMYLTNDKNRMKLNGITTIGDLKAGSNIVVSEIVAYPFGFLLYFNPPTEFKHAGVDITAFSDYDYDDKEDVMIPFQVYESNTFFPHDYRTKEEIQALISSETDNP